MTFSEYSNLELTSDARFEFCRGEAYRLPASSAAHAAIQRNCNRVLQSRLPASFVFSNGPRLFIVKSGLYTYADLSVFVGPIARDGSDACLNPKTLFEVLSPASRRSDRISKSIFYPQIPSLEEYVLIEQASYCVDRYWRLPDGGWELTRVQGEDAILELPSLNLAIPLSEIYADVPFELAEREPEQP